MTSSVDDLINLANTGRSPHMIELGHNYLKGHDYEGNEFPQDFVEAKKWLEKAHEKGATTASLLLGTMYENGNGMPRDINKAIELYEVAAQRGGYLPHLYLARIYSNGDGIERSFEMAVKWYRSVLAFDADEIDPKHLEEAQTFINNFDQSSA
jgi:TPR repeat protein